MAIPAQIKTLLSWLKTTRDSEISCDECLADLAEYLEAELESKPVPAALAAVREHLDFCSECREEYESLAAAVRALDTGALGGD